MKAKKILFRHLFVSLIILLTYGSYSLGNTSVKRANEDIEQGLHQEGIWILEEAGYYKEANREKQKLYNKLKNAPIVKRKGVQLGGATGAKLIELKGGIKAVFKKKSKNISSSYKSEIAAYLIDQLFSFSLIPMTVKRKINNKVGSLQYFIKKTVSCALINNYEKSNKMLAFDYLIKNRDRHAGNILIARNREIAIDHGLSLKTINFTGRFLKIGDKARGILGTKREMLRQVKVSPKKDPTKFRLNPNITKRINTISDEKVKKLLKNYLTKMQLKKLIHRLGKIRSVIL